MYAAIAMIVVAVVGAIIQGSAAKKQREAQEKAQKYLSSIKLLTEDQQALLLRRLESAKDDNAKMEILNEVTNAVVTAQLASTQYDVNSIYAAALASTGTGQSIDKALSDATAQAANNQVKLAVVVVITAVVVVMASVGFKNQQ